MTLPFIACPPAPARGRPWAAAVCGAIGLATVVLAFWRLDLRYALPTPRPAGFVEVAAGSAVALPEELERRVRAWDGPTLLHFFNAHCPCSRFNLEHVRELAGRFRGRVQVIAVLEEPDSDALAAFDELGTGFPAIVDEAGRAAAAVGVYSTPQAAILARDGSLYWRGNYNRSRYCTTRESEYARLALEHALAGAPAPRFETHAEMAYGCALPTSEGSVP